MTCYHVLQALEVMVAKGAESYLSCCCREVQNTQKIIEVKELSLDPAPRADLSKNPMTGDF